MKPSANADLAPSAASLIHSRCNISPRRLVAPGPDTVQLASIFEAACAAPDHGQLRPWRFVVVGPEKRVLLANAFEAALLERDPAATPDQRQRAAEKAHRAPVLVLAIACLDDGKARSLAGCRTLVVDSALEERRSQNWPQRGQFLPDSKANSRAIGPEAGEKCTAAASLQPTIPKSDSLLGTEGAGTRVHDHERIVALGCAIQNVLLMAQAHGFGSGLTSGQAMQSQALRQLFSLLPHEHAICCINLGIVSQPKARGQRQGIGSALRYL